VELGVHLPLLQFGDEPLSRARLAAAADAARECGLAAIAANDHFVFRRPWLDGPTALAAVLDRSGALELATTVALVSLRGPVALAKALAALHLLSGGRVVAGIGPGSSAADYNAVGVAFDERWGRFDEAAAILRALLRGEPPPPDRRHFALPDQELAPGPARPVPVWIGSWGSAAGLRRVARPHLAARRRAAPDRARCDGAAQRARWAARNDSSFATSSWPSELSGAKRCSAERALRIMYWRWR
jgi:alkanesulfonate monooxygenase SsuD/methylene tetrahydromethanopterin reductase-like flavin-dependent oxidoreductase (luciferase family)